MIIGKDTDFFIHLKGKKIYEGYFRLSLRHGYGTYFDDPFVRYFGNWKNDFPYGHGISFFRNGNIEYEGKWKQGYRNGNGILYSKENGKPLKNGKWKDDIFLGDHLFRKQKREEMFIHTFLETKNTEFLERVSPRNLRFFLRKREYFVFKIFHEKNFNSKTINI